MIGVVPKQAVGQTEELLDALVSDAIEDSGMLATGGHKAAPTQTPEVIRDFRLRATEASHEVGNRELAVLLQ